MWRRRLQIRGEKLSVLNVERLQDLNFIIKNTKRPTLMILKYFATNVIGTQKNQLTSQVYFQLCMKKVRDIV